MPLIDVRIAVIFALAFPVSSQPAPAQTSVTLPMQVREAEARFGAGRPTKGGAWCSTKCSVPAQSTDETAVLATVERVFQGMRTADSAMVRSAFAEGARFAGLDSAGAIRYASLDGWIRAIAKSAGRWEEPLYDVQVRVDETVAQVWAPYTFYLDKQVRHCGIDAFELLRTAAGWKITQISDTQRRQGCPDPLGSR